MIYIRPISIADHKAILEIAELAGFGMTSLPNDIKILKNKINNSIKSFSGKQIAGQESFVFVLFDTVKNKVAGISSIEAKVGNKRPFYSYKVSTLVQVSDSLGHLCNQKILHMVNDYTGASEVGGLFIHPDYRGLDLGRFMSKTRFLFMAQFPEFFSDTVISEIRGVHCADGESPFYNNVARKFINMSFKDADYMLSTQGGQFVTDLMPKYPIYVTFLDKAAQDVIGVPLDSSAPAQLMLKQEGFTHKNYIDLFDAGPTMEAERNKILTIKNSKTGLAQKTYYEDIYQYSSEKNYIMCNTQLKDFRAIYNKKSSKVHLLDEYFKILQVKQTDKIRYVFT